MTTSDTDFHALFLAKSEEAKALAPTIIDQSLRFFYERQVKFWAEMAKRVAP